MCARSYISAVQQAGGKIFWRQNFHFWGVFVRFSRPDQPSGHQLDKTYARLPIQTPKVDVVLLKSMESPHSPHGLHEDSWRVPMVLMESVGTCGGV